MKTTLLLTLAFICILNTCFSQQNSTWYNWAPLIGEWKGEGDGQPGKGSGTFSFTGDLNGKVIIRKSHSVYPATANKPEITHDDMMVIYTEKGNPAKAIYFDNEGHTINYSITYTDKTIVFVSDKTPNAPIFRLTYTMIDDKTVDTKFEMSQDGTNFMKYVEGKSIKTK